MMIAAIHSPLVGRGVLVSVTTKRGLGNRMPIAAKAVGSKVCAIGFADRALRIPQSVCEEPELLQIPEDILRPQKRGLHGRVFSPLRENERTFG